MKKESKIYKKSELEGLSNLKIDHVLGFVRQLQHTKGEFYGEYFEPLNWQKEILQDVYGTLTNKGIRQYKNVYLEIPKKNGKSGLLSALGLYHLCADGEHNAEVYGCASDKQQASIIFDVAADMVDQNPVLKKVIKPIISVKRLVYKPTRSFYQVVSAEAYSKHGLNVSCCLFDEIHAQPNRDLYDVMTFESGAARKQPIFYFISTAGDDADRTSIGWEVHENAEKVLLGTSNDKTLYARIWGVDDENNRIWTGSTFIQKENKIEWRNKKIWTMVNPSTGDVLDDEKFQESYDKINGNFASEKLFKQLRLNIWVKEKYTNWVHYNTWQQNGGIINEKELQKKECYGGLDLSSKLDLSSFVLTFPPAKPSEKHIVLPFFWLPGDNLPELAKMDKSKYQEWADKGILRLTKGNKIDYRHIRDDIIKLRDLYNFDEIGYDNWHADAVSIDLIDEGFEMVDIRQNFENLSPTMLEIEAMLHGKHINHGNNPILNWNFSNLQVITDNNGNIRPTKAIKQGSRAKRGHKRAKIDGFVAMLLSFCRLLANVEGCVYDERPEGSKILSI